MSDIVFELIAAGKGCSGCYACRNVCPKGAISMVLDDDGFCRSVVDSSACVDCGACLKVCPERVRVGGNDEDPRCYAFRAEDCIVEESASGGAFPVLAEWMLSRKGYVCGAVYDDEMNVVFKVTKDRDVVDRMRKSKYAFSEMGDVYKEIAKLISKGKEVLFVGCPCQVAAVRNFVKDDPKLYTADLVCAGMPSKGVYRKYLEELSADKEVEDLQFRHSHLPYGTLVVKYKDGSAKTIFRDPYFHGFLGNMFKSKACTDCKYASFPRVGDITLGDLWQYDKILFDVDGSTGISCVTVNNDHGAEMLKVLSKNAGYLREVPISFLKRFNRFSDVRPHSPHDDRFYYLLDRGHPVSKALDYSINKKYDVAVTGFWRVNNYGGDLTYYALYNVLKDMGLEPVFVEAFDPKRTEGTPPGPSRLMTAYPAFSIAPWYSSREKMAEINHRVKNIMVGSDQVWNPRLLSPNGLRSYALSFAAPWRNTVAYASSFGATDLKADTPEKKELVGLLKRIKHVSVRESSGVDICRKFGIEAKHVLDPVMLCDMKHYQELIDNASMSFQEGCMLAFVRHVNVHMDPVAMSEHLGIPSMNVGGPDMDYSQPTSYPLINVGSVENWLKAISRSSFVLTDSFHALAMAIVFRKPFIAVYGRMDEANGNGRMSSLLTLLGLENRLFRTTAEAIESGVPKEPVDYDAVYEKLDAFRGECLEWLRSSLEF